MKKIATKENKKGIIKKKTVVKLTKNINLLHHSNCIEAFPTLTITTGVEL